MTTSVRERILDAALNLMGERGAAGTSMRQLAQACDVQVAALYHYFESKEALLAAVIAERNYAARLADPPPLDRSASPSERVRSLFDMLWRGALEEEPVLRLLLGEAIRSEPAALPVGRDLLDALTPGVASWLNDWVPEVSHPDLLAQLIVGQLFLTFIDHLFDPDADVEALGRSASECILMGVR
jgi:AcrR family transcriptional regulator